MIGFDLSNQYVELGQGFFVNILASAKRYSGSGIDARALIRVPRAPFFNCFAYCLFDLRPVHAVPSRLFAPSRILPKHTAIFGKRHP